MEQNTALTVDDITSKENSSASIDSEQYLTFKLAGEEYGIEIMRVQGIQSSTNISKIPNTPNYILGVINLRGQIVPIIDLRVRFSLKQIPFDKNTVVIIAKLKTKNEEKLLGVVVDGVSETYRFEPDQIQASPQLSIGDDDYLKGIALAEGKLVILLDIDKIIEIDKINEYTK